MRARILAWSCLCLASCGKAAATPGESALAAPVLVPMQAREQLLHDLDEQKQKARDRADQLDRTIGSDR